jgi:multimeric flavodoxin WrbA
MLLPKLKEADVIVWASPVYYAGITGPLKNLMDRQLPFFMQENTGSKKQKAVLHLRSLGVVHVRSAPGANEGYLR